MLYNMELEIFWDTFIFFILNCSKKLDFFKINNNILGLCNFEGSNTNKNFNNTFITLDCDKIILHINFNNLKRVQTSISII